ncbi:M14 family metallopeptidase [Aliidiomarina sp. Khilg15.8]
MTDTTQNYPIGTPGKPWGEKEKADWLNAQQPQRSYFDDVVTVIDTCKNDFAVEQYGELDYTELGVKKYPLFVIKTLHWDKTKPTVLVTGGVHGYETSGVHGALSFIQHKASQWAKDFNLVIAPCISPWGYETINRWTPKAVDPNRSFIANSPAQESAAIMDYVKRLDTTILAHIDLHETTDTDNSEFRPALAARDGVVNENWNIPDGFYLVGDSTNLALDFQKSVLDSVAEVTHIADADAQGNLIGAAIDAPGLISFPTQELGLCIGFSGARYTTTTEVYPDSPKASDAICVRAQVAAVEGGLRYLQKNVI